MEFIKPESSDRIQQREYVPPYLVHLRKNLMHLQVDWALKNVDKKIKKKRIVSFKTIALSCDYGLTDKMFAHYNYRHANFRLKIGFQEGRRGVLDC